jgi:ABC-type anion transport system duplicated permease subunit
MSPRFKKVFLIMTVVVPFILYCVYYYGMMIKNAPYRSVDFQSISFEYGHKDSLKINMILIPAMFQYL